ncbi:MAG: 2-C-methyl-D-erythritol 4-phosphate cytidylyltransferase [Phycisphaeraceae bacterium]|nr:2-C-methyl-D-erythritol 4-phosphate cytidylyltransferase [Phycisphaeraceae bacterium]
MKIAVIMPAAGLGRRFANEGEKKSKIELELAGRAVFLRSLSLFWKRPEVGQVILAVHPEGVEAFKLRWGDQLGFHGVTVVAGGVAERWETVMKALKAVKEDITHVAVHDAVRPLASAAMITRVFETAERYPAVIPAVPVNATLKRVEDVQEEDDQADDPLTRILGAAAKPRIPIQKVTATLDRAATVEVQTPQVFSKALLEKAYAQIRDGKIAGEALKGVTDDARLVEMLGETVYVVAGEATNLKITRPDDVKLAEAILKESGQEEAKLLARKRLFANEEE